MDLELVRNFCLKKKGVTESYPFDEVTPVYKVMNKMFCLSNLTPPYFINIKCDPENAIELREEYEQVRPGWHMNKKYWNSVYFEGNVSDQQIFEWITDSYNLVVDSLKKSEKAELEKM